MKKYRLDVEKIQTMQDVRDVFEAFDLHFTEPDDAPKEEWDKIRHMLKEVKDE